MTQRLFYVFCLITAAVPICPAQTRTVTNTDLEKYKQARVKAETDLRVNYARLGFASPEERARRDAQAAKEREELAARLQRDALMRERLDAERAASENRAATFYRVPQSQLAPSGYDIGYTYFWSGGRRFRFPRFNFVNRQPGYFAGGMFIPTGPSKRAQPLIRVAPRRR